MTENRNVPRRGRGSVANPDARFAEHQREAVDDGWYPDELQPLRTELGIDSSRTIISRNQSPDIPFDRSVNPYRGCEHGCIYCYARPTHAWLGISPGLDFESRLFYKPDATEQLERELAKHGYEPATMMLGANTDPYQPVERKLGITRQLLEVLRDCRHPVAVTTKSALVLRDLELLGEMAADRAEKVLSLIRQCRGGELNDARFGRRFSGTGPVAELLQKRCELAVGRLGLLRQDAGWDLDVSRFRPPSRKDPQLSLFD